MHTQLFFNTNSQTPQIYENRLTIGRIQKIVIPARTKIHKQLNYMDSVLRHSD